MTDLRALETELLAAVTAANDEAALEAVRVAALGRNGSVSALLKTLGTMTPEARKEQGPLINSLKERVSAAIHSSFTRTRQRAWISTSLISISGGQHNARSKTVVCRSPLVRRVPNRR